MYARVRARTADAQLVLHRLLRAYQCSNGKYLVVDPFHFLHGRSEVGAADTVFELHRVSDAPPRFAIRSAIGRFLNVDDNIELALKEKSNKDPGVKADRDGGESYASLTDREKSFELIEVDGGIAIRAPDEFFIAVDTNEEKVKLTRNATYQPPAVEDASLSATAASVAAAATAATALPYATLTPVPAEVLTPTWVDDRSPLSLAGRHLLRTAHGLLWCGEPSGQLIANRSAASLWEPVRVLALDLTHVAFQSCAHGGLLTFQRDGRRLVSFTADEVGADERFELVELDKRARQYAIRANNGAFLCAQGNHAITATSKQCGPWETFHLIAWNREI